MSRLTDTEVDARLGDGPWRRVDGELQLDRTFADFAAALDFLNRVAALAEEADHHPDLLLHGWNKVRLRLSTHSEGGLTAKDLDLAARIDGLG